MQYEGKIIKILPLEQIGQNNTDKRSVVLEENRDSEYKGGLVFDLRGDKVSMIDGYNEGDIITVSLNARAREYNGRWYNSLSGWKIEGSASATNANESENTTSTDDLPF